jgi:type IV pilus assembly protein PilW
VIAAVGTLRARGRQTGAGMVETMIGILIGLLVVLVVYNLLSVAEGYKRMTAGVSDAQITGLLSQFLASRDAGNGGNGISLAAPDLVNCTDTTLRPVPVRITAGASPIDSDSFISMHSGAPRVLWPVPLLNGTSTPSLGDPFEVQSPNGFSAPDGTSVPTVAKPYRVIVIDGTGNCQLVKVTGVSSPPALATGGVTLTFDATTIPSGTFTGGAAAAAPAKVLILGPDGLANRIRYEVFNTTTNTNCTASNAPGCQLVTTNLLPPAGSRTPIAQNVVLMKAQYGVDTNNDDRIDCWTPADNSNACGDGRDYSDISDPATFPFVEDLQRIMAVRIGVIVRSDEPALLDPATTTTVATPRDIVLFDCSTHDGACQGRVVVPAGIAASFGSPVCTPYLICDGWRYRSYDTVIPLRNSIFNATL